MDDMSTDPLSDDAMPFGGHLRTWQEARRRSDVRLAAAEAAHNRQIQLLTKRIEELEQAARRSRAA